MHQKALALAVAATLSACVSIDEADGVITHTNYSITESDRSRVQSMLQSKLKAPGLQMRGLEGSENLSTGAITICGYVSGISRAGTRSPDAVFGGFFLPGHGTFTLFGAKGQGQDPARIHEVKTICGSAGIYI